MAEGLDLSQHINVFNQIISDLKRIDVKFEDEDKALMLLNSLPTSSTYENLVTTLMWGKETLDLEEIMSILLGFNQRKNANDESSQGEGLWQRVIRNVGETSSGVNQVTINPDLNLGRERTYNVISAGKRGTETRLSREKERRLVIGK